MQHQIRRISALSALLFPAAAFAQPIPVANADFELPALLANGFTNGDVPGWTNVGGTASFGVFYPTVAGWQYTAPSGNQVFYTNGTTVQQTLATTLQAGQTYTLRVDVVHRPIYGGNPYFIQLLAGATPIATDNNTLSPPVGAFLTSVLVYSSPAGDPRAGQPLAIRLGGDLQANFDNVRLNAGAVCYANCDNSTITPVLNVSDFICFQTKYAAGDPYANCDNSTIPPILNVSDFICFQTKYSAGCQ